jgi:homoserine kinase
MEILSLKIDQVGVTVLKKSLAELEIGHTV